MALVVVVVVAAGALGFASWRRARRAPSPWQRLESGRVLYDAGAFGEALEQFQQVARDLPREKRAWLLAGICKRRLGRAPAEWLADVRQALALDPALPEALRLVAQAELDAGRVEEAEAAAEKLRSAAGEDAQVLWLLLQIELRRPRPDLHRALSLTRRARQAGIDAPEAVLTEVQIRLRLRGPTPAPETDAEFAALLRQALRVLDRDAPARGDGADVAVERVRILLAQAEVDAAFRECEKALAAGGDRLTGPQRATLLFLRAQAWDARDRDNEPKLYANPRRLDVDQAVAADASVGFALLVADYEVRMGRLDDAERVLLPHCDASDPAPALFLAAVRIEAGRLDEAGALLERTAERAGNLPYLETLRGDLAAARGDAAAAREAYRRALAAGGATRVPSVRLALLAARPGASAAERDDAVAGLASLTGDTDGGDPDAWRALALVEAARGRSDAAIAAARARTRLAPTDPESWTLLGRCALLPPGEDAARDAGQAFDRARALDPSHRGACLGLAQALLRLGQAGEAAAACSTALRNTPDDGELLALRASAYRLLGRWDAAALDLTRLAATPERSRETFLQAVEALYRAGERDRADTLVRQALENCDAETRAALEFVRALGAGDAEGAFARAQTSAPTLVLADLLLAAARHDDAARVLRQVLEQHPGDAGATWRLVLALLDGDQVPDAAVAEARAAAAALSAAHDAPERALVEGRLLLRDGNAEAASALLERAAAALGHIAAVQYLAAEARWAAGERESTLPRYRSAVLAPGATPAMRRRVAGVLVALAAGSAGATRRLDLLREAVRLDPASGPAWNALTLEQMSAGDFSAAAATAQRALTSRELDAPTLLALRRRAALSAAAAGKRDTAEQLLRSFSEEESASPEGVTLRAFADLRAGRGAQAVEALRALVLQDDAPPLAVLVLADALTSGGDTAAAAELAADWLRRHASDSATALGVAGLLSVNGYAEASLGVVRTVAADRPPSVELVQLECILLARLGRAAEALQRAEALLATVPETEAAAAHLLCGFVAARFLKDPERGLREAEAARAAAAASPRVRRLADVLRGEALLLLGRAEEAGAIADDALAAAERDALELEAAVEARLCVISGTADAAAERFERAARSLGRAVELDPANSVAWNNLAFALARAGDPHQALRYARRATELAPEDPGHWDTRADSAAAAGETEEARTSWERALGLFPTRRDAARAVPDVVVRFAEWLAAEGRGDEASELAALVAELDPAPPEAARALRIVRRSGR